MDVMKKVVREADQKEMAGKKTKGGMIEEGKKEKGKKMINQKAKKVGQHLILLRENASIKSMYSHSEIPVAA
jgi:hypothetical protein